MSMTVAPAARWPQPLCIAFRFFFVYCLLYFFPLPSGLANPEWLSTCLDPFWQWLVTPVADAVFDIKLTVFTNGSGDTTYDYIRVLCMAVIAAFATLVWSVLDWRRRDYRHLYAWSRLWLRYALAMSMLTYGAAKVVPLQFQPPDYEHLTQRFGDFSPMGLLWNFMGASLAYTIFAGAGEMLACVLLLFRRTTLLGLLVTVGVMSQVAALNYCYDVPVKLGASHLLLLALCMLAPDGARLLDVFVRNRPVAAADLPPHLAQTWQRRVGLGLKVAVIAIAFATEFTNNLGGLAPRQRYTVESATLDGAAPAGDQQWKTVALQFGFAVIHRGSGAQQWLKIDGDPEHGTFRLLPQVRGQVEVGKPPVAELQLATGQDGKATLTGTFDGKSLQAALTPVDLAQFQLVKRGFHWINEFPFNR